jgi:N-acetylmuramoyl-L-alanine amidase
MPTEADIDIVARTIYGEARGEGYRGMVAVAWVIRNRVEADLGHDGKPDWWGEGYAGVCLKPWQFSAWNENDPNRKLLEGLTDLNMHFLTAKEAARDVLEGKVGDPTNMATHYFNPHVVAAPKWAGGKIPCAIIGDHHFYRCV